MGKPSYAQVKFAESLGVQDAGNYQDSVELSKAIAAAQGKEYVPFNPTNKVAPKPVTSPTGPQTAMSNIILTRTDKPHSYEFGKASARHKIYYNTVSELLDQIEQLKQFNLVENELLINPEEFK